MGFKRGDRVILKSGACHDGNARMSDSYSRYVHFNKIYTVKSIPSKNVSPDQNHIDIDGEGEELTLYADRFWSMEEYAERIIKGLPV